MSNTNDKISKPQGQNDPTKSPIRAEHNSDTGTVAFTGLDAEEWIVIDRESVMLANGKRANWP